MKISEAASQQFLTLLSLATKDALSAGDTFIGRILSIENGLVLMQLLDGSKVSAQVKSDAQYSAGDVLRLEVVEQNQGQILVRDTESLGTKAQLQNEKQNSEQLLAALKLPTDKNHQEVMKAVLQMGVKPTAELVTKSVNLLRTADINDPKQAAFLVLNGMNDKQEYVGIMKQFSEQAFRFTDKWGQLFAEIEKAGDKTLIHFAEKMLQRDAVQKLDLESATANLTKILASEKNIAGKLQKLLMSFDGDITSIEDAAHFSSIVERYLPDVKKLQTNQRNMLQGLLRDLLMQVKIQKSTLPKDMQAVKAFIKKEASLVDPKLEVQSEQARFPKAEAWMEDVENKLSLLHDVLSQVEGGDGEKILPQVRELQSAIQFFRDITHYEAFVQLPIALKDNSTEGDLYIMKRKGKRGKLNANDFSLFLSLTTKNIGIMDTFVHVRSRNVSLRVMLEDEQYQELLMNEYKPLYEALQAKGFHLYELKYSNRNEGLNLFNAEKKAMELISVQNKKIDIKV